MRSSRSEITVSEPALRRDVRGAPLERRGDRVSEKNKKKAK